MESDLEVLLSSPPPFPGVRLHIITDIETTPIEFIENTDIKFPVNIHSVDRKVFFLFYLILIHDWVFIL